MSVENFSRCFKISVNLPINITLNKYIIYINICHKYKEILDFFNRNIASSKTKNK